MEPKKAAEVSTGLKMETQTFTWKITNFDMISQSDKFIKMQRFRFKAGEVVGLETQWMVYLTVEKKTEGEGSGDRVTWIGVVLECTKRPVNVNEVIALCQISILSENNEQVKIVGSLKPRSVDNYAKQNWGCPKLIRKDDEKFLWIDRSLALGIEFHLYAHAPPPAMLTTAAFGTAASIHEQFKPVFTKKLQSDLEVLRDTSTQTSDMKVKIVSMDNKEFAVNGGVLSVRSRVFRKMLEVDMKEANTGVIIIDDLCSKTITVLLRYIYTGTLHKDWSSEDVIVPLVYAAAKYELSDLLEFLDNVLGKVCSTENAGQLLNLADKLGLKKATQEILERIKKDFSSKENMMALLNSFSESDND